MRLSQLLENVNDDIAILSKIADLVLSWLPNEIPTDDYIRIDRISNDSVALATFLKYIPSIYHNTAIQLLTKTNYIFNNTKKHQNATEVGVHVLDNKTGISSIIINVSAFLESHDSISKNELLNIRLNDKPFKTIKSILMHEMRHGQQHTNYGGHPNTDNHSYSTNPDEIDAAWIHHLQDYDVNGYADALSYVKDVMSSFEIYKSLTEKQKRHYLKKTASYWYEHHNPNKESISIQDKAKKAKEDKIQEILANVSDTMNIDGINDLRTYDGYPSDSSNFLLPYENFVKVTHNALTADNDYSDKMVSYVYAFLSMLHDRLGFDISIAKKVLTNKYSITLKDAINLIDAEGFGKFDKDYFIMVMNKSL